MYLKSSNLKSILVFSMCLYLYSCNKDSNNLISNIIPQGEWVPKAPMPTTANSTSNFGRSAAVSFVIEDNAYVGTGFTQEINSDLKELNNFWKYAPLSNSWTQIASLPDGEGRHGAFAFSINKKGFVGGGSSYDTRTTTNTFYEYDPTNNTWTLKGLIPDQEGLFGCFAFTINNLGYIGGGGWNKIQNKIYSYNIDNESWNIVDTFPAPPIVSAETFVHNQKAYVIGGSLEGGPTSSMFYSFDGTKWETIRSLSDIDTADYDDQYATIPRESGVAFVINDWAYIVGGETNNVLNETTWSYDIKNNKWYPNTPFVTTESMYSSKRIDGIGITVNNKGYFLTGLNYDSYGGISNSYNSNNSNFYELNIK